jgi:hypothetical protein
MMLRVRHTCSMIPVFDSIVLKPPEEETFNEVLDATMHIVGCYHPYCAMQILKLGNCAARKAAAVIVWNGA